MMEWRILILGFIAVLAFAALFLLRRHYRRSAQAKPHVEVKVFAVAGATWYSESGLTHEGVGQAGTAMKEISDRTGGHTVLVLEPSLGQGLRESSEIIAGGPGFKLVLDEKNDHWWAEVLGVIESDTQELNRWMHDYTVTHLLVRGQDFEHLRLVVVVHLETLQRYITNFSDTDRDTRDLGAPGPGAIREIHFIYNTWTGEYTRHFGPL